jgi:ATP-dependent Clp protease adaptor protein ClpS
MSAEPSTPGATVAPPVTEKTTDVKPRLTPRYRVLVHNDDVTPAAFVVVVLMRIFRKNQQDAMQIMETAHFTGVALVTVLPLEQAELRTEQAHSLARTQKFPLTFTYEPE